ncbi:MAG: hypothetical protein HQM03_14195 [Magnetococcales bacterium]|nr:hypothetical protein [Magnetococcales bacterium]
MTRPEQKLSEINRVKHLLSSLALNGKVTGGPDSNTSPDCVITMLDGKIIAVEVTEFHYGGQPANDTAAWSNIKNIAYNKRSLENKQMDIAVVLYFRDGRLPKMRKHADFVNAIISFIDRKIDDLSDEMQYFKITNEDEILYYALEKISLWRAVCYMDWDWNRNVGSFSMPHENRELIKTINRKLSTERPTGYDEFWLVVTGGVVMSESIFVMKIQNLSMMPIELAQGPFDNIFLWDTDWFYWNRESGWKVVPSHSTDQAI